MCCSVVCLCTREQRCSPPVIGSPSLKNELISGCENLEANRWAKSTSRSAGVVDEANVSDRVADVLR